MTSKQFMLGLMLLLFTWAALVTYDNKLVYEEIQNMDSLLIESHEMIYKHMENEERLLEVIRIQRKTIEMYESHEKLKRKVALSWR